MEERPADPAQGAAASPRLPGRAGTGETLFFSTPELEQRLDLLRHLTDNSEKILLVKGARGAGKTTLLQQYRKAAREEWDLCCLQASPQLQPDQLYALLLRRFGITEISELNVDHLLRRFEMLRAAGRLPIVVIDDADQLPAATVIAIFRLFERRPGSRALIRVVLFATPDIATLLHTPQLQAMNLQTVQSLELPLLSRDQAQAFVRFLLQAAMQQPDLQIAPGRLSRIVRESAGLPGELVGQLQQLFVSGPPSTPTGDTTPASVAMPTRGRMSILTDLPLWLVLSGAALSVLLLLTLIFQGEINRLFESTPTGAADVAEEQSAGQSPIQKLQLPRESDLKSGQEMVTQADVLPQDDSPLKPASPPALALPELAQERGPELPEPVTEDVAGPAVDPAPVTPQTGATEAADLATLSARDAEPGPSVEEKPKRAPEPVPEATSETVPPQPPVKSEPIKAAAEEPAERSATGSLAPSPPASAAQAKEPVAESRQNGLQSPAVAAPIKGEAWLREQAPGHYTLQLVAVGSEPAARRFISQYRLAGDVAIFKTRRDGKAWYAVLQGVFPDRDAAIKGRSRLPAPLNHQDPWPRTFASVHAALGN